MPNEEVDTIGTVKVLLHHKLSDIENLGYIWAGQNSSGPSYATTGLYTTTNKVAYNSYFKGSLSGGCTILTSALEDDNYYIMATDFLTENVRMKANKVTIVDNEIVIGPDINGSTTAKGTETLTADIGILSGRTNSSFVYSSKHKIVWIKFYDKQGNLMHEFNFSEGAGNQTFDAVTGNAYDILNINPDVFWNQKQDINHYNFRYGFTLYQKSGSPDKRIPNRKDQTEITPPPETIPSGYSRVENYKECRKIFNNCESKFKLDNVDAETKLIVSGAGNEILNGAYDLHGLYDGKEYWYDGDLSTYTHFFNWGNNYSIWNWGFTGGQVAFNSPENVDKPEDVVTWNATPSGVLPVGTITRQVASPLYTSDPDRILFDTDGTAKEFDIKLFNMASISDRGYLYYNETLRNNFMLYGTNKTLLNDVKIIKYIGMNSRIVYDESGAVEYDENNHTKLTEV